MNFTCDKYNKYRAKNIKFTKLFSKRMLPNKKKHVIFAWKKVRYIYRLVISLTGFILSTDYTDSHRCMKFSSIYSKLLDFLWI